MKSFTRFLFLPVVLCLTTLSMARPVCGDSLPPGTRISLDITLPGEATSTHVRYTVPALPSVVVVPAPAQKLSVVPTFDAVTNRLKIAVTGGGSDPPRYTIPGVIANTLQPAEGFLIGANALNTTVTITASAEGKTVTLPYFIDDAEGTTTVVTKVPVVPILPVPVQPIPPVDLVPVSGKALRFPVTYAYSQPPNRINRLQAPVQSPYLDGWAMKQHELVAGGDGGIQETPDALRQRGHNWFSATWFYGGQGAAPWGLPHSGDNLFFEYTGDYWQPYVQNPALTLTTDFATIANTLVSQLPTWNSEPANGLIDGVSTVKDGYFNLEYKWISADMWAAWPDQQKQATFFNDAIGRSETLQQCYNRGGIGALQQAHFQKWYNIITFSIKYLNSTCNGMKAYYGDFIGIAPCPDLQDWNLPYSAQQLLNADVNDPAYYAEANEYANAGTVTVRGQTYDVTGNVRQTAGRSNAYYYENSVFMKGADATAYFAIGPSAPASQKRIEDWYPKMQPRLVRPYEIAFHALLTQTVKRKKGWNDYKVFWQTEPNYEFSILIPDQGYREVGAVVPWTLNDAPRPVAKIPLHPEVAGYLTILARLHYDGKLTWGPLGYSRMNLDNLFGGNLHPAGHLTSREAEQATLSELGQYNSTVFTPDKRQHIGDIAIQNPVTGQYLTGTPDQLLRANGDVNRPVPLVTAVDSPSTGWELYQVYYPHTARDGRTTVRWKSPVDGAELTGEAIGWGSTLYARKR